MRSFSVKYVTTGDALSVGAKLMWKIMLLHVHSHVHIPQMNPLNHLHCFVMAVFQGVVAPGSSTKSPGLNWSKRLLGHVLCSLFITIFVLNAEYWIQRAGLGKLDGSWNCWKTLGISPLLKIGKRFCHARRKFANYKRERWIPLRTGAYKFL